MNRVAEFMSLKPESTPFMAAAIVFCILSFVLFASLICHTKPRENFSSLAMRLTIRALAACLASTVCLSLIVIGIETRG